ncbi:MAG: bifunctional glutamate N-acetyltransferase/amino-acid acetyltransferase ArgJ [Rickettsiales bacterium]|nr:bifunctional glutamate N-acetyltransferase/amino-acid acetyltransferase ArgJ [Rickettsiales bacterium]
MSGKVSPFASDFPVIPNVSGVELFSACSGMRYKKDDVLFVRFAKNTSVAGVFTKNSMPGEPVVWCKNILHNGKASALVVNSGYSNVFCGAKGIETINKTTSKINEIYNFPKEEIYIASTGIIGQPINDKLLLEALESKLKPCDWQNACVAINTTDTFNKAIYKTAKIGEREVKIVGIIKGSGMIAPDMATMLGFIFTDANIPANILQELMSEVTLDTYNSITVDSDTSTSDTILAFATNQAGNEEIEDINSKNFSDFREKFFEVNLELAKLVVRDGEGISKFVTIEITGAKDNNSARKIALAVANSPLVKTAIAGQDANWGRIIGAIGKCGEPANRDKTSIWIGNLQPALNGQLNPNYSEKEASLYMKNSEINIKAEIGVGQGVAKVYTTDLTHGYIEINADYRS